MRYVSPEGRLVGPDAAFDQATGPAALLDRIRERLGGGVFISAVLVFLVTITVSRSTSTVNWVDGIDVITWVAVAAALLMGVLALLPVREPIALGVGFVLAPLVAFFAAWPQIHFRHPGDVIGPQLVNVWWDRISQGEAGS